MIPSINPHYPVLSISSIHSHLRKNVNKEKPDSQSQDAALLIIYPFWGTVHNGPFLSSLSYKLLSSYGEEHLLPQYHHQRLLRTMVWYPNNMDLRDRAMQLSFDIRKLQHSAREKLVPAERLEQKRQMVDQVDNFIRSIEVQDFPDLQHRLFATLTAQERMTYERLVERLRPVGQVIDPTLEVYTLSLISGSLNKTVNVADTLHIAHLVATMRDYARSFVILCKYGLEAGKSAFVISTQSARLVNDIIGDDERLVKYASRSAYFLRLVATAGLSPDLWVSQLSRVSSEEEQRQKLQVAIRELYLRRLVSLFFERLCDAMMLHDGLLQNYLTYLAGRQVLYADETTILLIKTMMNAWCNIDIATSVNMIAGTDAQRDSGTEGDLYPSNAVQHLDEMTACVDVGDLTEGSQHEGYDLTRINDLYEDDTNMALPHEYDVDAQLQDIDRIFARFLPYSAPNV